MGASLGGREKPRGHGGHWEVGGCPASFQRPLPTLCGAPCHPELLSLVLETLSDTAPLTTSVLVSLLRLLPTLAVGTAPDLPIPHSYLWTFAHAGPLLKYPSFLPSSP